MDTELARLEMDRDEFEAWEESEHDDWELMDR
jgi:hypothetical protein